MKIETISPDSMWSHIAQTSFVKQLNARFRQNSKISINIKSQDQLFIVSVRINFRGTAYNSSFSKNTIEEAATLCALNLNKMIGE